METNISSWKGCSTADWWLEYQHLCITDASSALSACRRSCMRFIIFETNSGTLSTLRTYRRLSFTQNAFQIIFFRVEFQTWNMSARKRKKWCIVSARVCAFNYFIFVREPFFSVKRNRWIETQGENRNPDGSCIAPVLHLSRTFQTFWLHIGERWKNTHTEISSHMCACLSACLRSLLLLQHVQRRNVG